MSAFGGDSFVALPPSTKHGVILFAKNSCRPVGEVQEVVFFPRRKHSPGSKLQVNSDLKYLSLLQFVVIIVYLT